MDVVSCAIVVAGGAGSRAGRTGGKQLARVAGRPVVAWSVDVLDRCGFERIVIVCPPEQVSEYRESVLEPLDPSTPVYFAASGPSRHDSVRSGLGAVPPSVEIVAIHDGARPLITSDVVIGAVDHLTAHPEADGVVVGHPSVDTLKTVADGRVAETLDRARIWSIQTPQVFRLASIMRAHERAAGAEDPSATDDAALVEAAGGTVLTFEGPRDNIKVTLPEDFALVESVLAQRLGRG